MDLKDALRRDRARGKVKEPFFPSLFSHVGGLVRRYHLGEDFCGLVDSMTPAAAETLARRCLSAAKPPYEAPLFFLATSAEFLVIQKILAGLNNPFLAFAHCPEEILLSATLWQRRPGLDPEALTSRHFAALL
jgi:hypothetical protein